MVDRIPTDKFDAEYFTTYDTLSEDGTPPGYDESNFRKFVAHAESMAPICKAMNIVPRRVLDLGAATGLLMRDMKNNLPGVEQADGIEISDWAIANKVPDLPNLWQGDIFDAPALIERSTGQSPVERYDVIVANLIMYMSPAQLDELLDMIKDHLLRDGGILFLRTYHSPADGVVRYAGRGLTQHDNDSNLILARPRNWWRKMISFGDRGKNPQHRFIECADLGGGNMAFQSCDLLRDVSNVSIKWPDENCPYEEQLKGLDCPLTISNDQGLEASFHLSDDRQTFLEVEGLTNFDVCDVANRDALARMVKPFHAGEFHVRNVTFLPRKDYLFIPGCFSISTDEGWVASTDYDYENMPPLEV